MVKSAKNLKTERDGLSRAVYLFTLGSFLFALVYLFVRATGGEGELQSGELRIIIFQLVMGCVFLRVPYLISRVTRVRIPTGLSVGYFAFLWCAIFLGEFALFYYRVALWDAFLHLFSAALAALAALSLPSLLGVRGQPLITMLVAVGAALTLGVAWEVYEFAFDGILGLNMQKFAAPSPMVNAAQIPRIPSILGAAQIPLTPSLVGAAQIPRIPSIVSAAQIFRIPSPDFAGLLSGFFGGTGSTGGALTRLFGISGGTSGALSELFGKTGGLVGAFKELFGKIGSSVSARSELFGAVEVTGKLAPLVGRDALVDTMTDLILDLVGAATVGIWGYVYIKRHGDLPPSVRITRDEG